MSWNHILIGVELTKKQRSSLDGKCDTPTMIFRANQRQYPQAAAIL